MAAKERDTAKLIDRFLEPPNQVDPKVLDAEVERRLGAVRGTQGNYQPIFGLDEAELSPRRALLEQNCRYVEAHFSSTRKKQQIRVIDVGSNAGFITLSLAKTFPQILGTETDPTTISLCHALAQKTRSTARFANINVLDLLDSGDIDLENVDCVLLFNVVHQFIFARGLQYVQMAIKKIVESVDVVFIELATRDQYVPHKKDHLLPIEAEEVLSKCVNCDVDLLRVDPRPLYKLRRRSLPLSSVPFEFDTVKFSGHENPLVSRKYYSSGAEFLKLYRFTPGQDPSAFHAEVQGLLRLQGQGVCPDIVDWGKNTYSGYIRMGRLYGRLLSSHISHFNGGSNQKRMIFELFRLAHALAKAGIHQNDFTAHNMIILSDGSLRLLDFEQTQPLPLRDPFAFLLWVINDIYTGRRGMYERGVVDKLILSGTVRADTQFYPNRSELLDAGLSLEFVDDAFSASDWKQFVTKWHAEFQPYSVDTPESRV